ncbi:precorrin-4 C(11)-methyltransferase [Ferrimicrobium sp.]|uniref:precorrin-4 C(11)-methyltransferase n=1 Tax=Ferrimicrobium sp. TaxID=2926050 RepID=UPI002631D549|nr:precorrin-4 C(11)-methyltransferase [Ferrimicrobium sp.]
MEFISFVGAGPGAPDLITLRGQARLRDADIIIWASSLIPEEMLEWAGDEAVRMDSAEMTLEDVLLVFEHNPDARIVRLHSGDPSIYGAIQEQISWCEDHERPFEIVPGVTSISAAAAAVGRELTIPQVSQSVVTTRVARRTSASMPESESLARYAQLGGTIAVLLSGAHPHRVVEELLVTGSKFSTETPVAVVVRATWPDERVAMTTIGDLVATLAEVGAKRTLLLLVGDVLTTSDIRRSHLYSPAFSHRFRSRSNPGTTAGRAKRRANRSVR